MIGIGFGNYASSYPSVPLPLTIPNLLAWWDGSRNRYSDLAATTPAAYGSPVRTWVTRDGSNLAASTDADADDAYGNGGGIDGSSGPGIYTTANGQTLTSSLSITRPYTIIIVGTPGVNAYVYQPILASRTPDFESQIGAVGGACYLSGSASTASPFPTDDSPSPAHIYLLRCDNSGCSVWLDGVDVTTNSALTQDWGTLILNALGHACTVSQAVVYARKITDGEATSLTGYFSAVTNIITDGNSLTVGVTDTFGGAWPAVLANSLAVENPLIRVANTAVSGETTPQLITAASSRVDPLFLAGASKNVVVLWEATNDMFVQGSSTAAQAYAHYQTYSAARIAANSTVRVVLVNCMTRDAGAEDAQIEAFNALLAADFTIATSSPYVWLPTGGVTIYGAKMLVDLFDVPDLRDSTNLTYFSSDQLHLTDAGEAVVAGVMQTALGLLP